MDKRHKELKQINIKRTVSPINIFQINSMKDKKMPLLIIAISWFSRKTKSIKT